MSRIKLLWRQLQGSLWSLPALMTAVAIVLAFVMVGVDRANLIADDRLRFAFEAGAEGARGVLSTIAGSIITVTGVVFSITIVVLQLTSSQFTPRVLRSFTEDRAVQLVLGVFIGTFTYSLLVLRTVRSSLEERDAFVPSISVTVAVLLALISIGFLIYFINHIARSIQVELIMDRVTRDALRVVDTLFPEELGDPVDDVEETALPQGERTTTVRATSSGYLQAIDEDALLALAEEHDIIVALAVRVGDFIIENDALAVVAGDVDDAVGERLRHSLTQGPERTRFQDVERGIIELTDIGVRALSPGINDPTTAVVCIDRLTQIMARLTRRRLPQRQRAGSDGRLRVIARRPEYQDLVRLGYSSLRHNSRAQPRVAIALAISLARLLDAAPLERRAPLREQLAALIAAARQEWQNEPELSRLEAVARS